MRQVIQNYKTGEVKLELVPVPLCVPKNLLVKNVFSLISIGTERMMIDLGKKSLLGKAYARPDLFNRVLEKIKTEGVLKTFQEAMNRLESPVPLGYSAAGSIIEVGREVNGFSPAEQVVCVGHGLASHAEFMHVPQSFVYKIPHSVPMNEAAFAMLGAIALHGVRKIKGGMGSTIVVIGLGLLGLITIQLLKAYGCRVFAFDINSKKLALAKVCGADFVTTDKIQLEAALLHATHQGGADNIILTASGKTNDPLSLAVKLCGFKAKIVIVGTTAITIDRNALWEKEIELVVSKAGGLETDGTLSRNINEFIRLLENKKISMAPLITHVFPIAEAENVYRTILNDKLENPIGVLFQYPYDTKPSHQVVLSNFPQKEAKNAIQVSVIGAGVFAKSTFFPNLKKQPKIKLKTLVSASGLNATISAKKYKFATVTTDDSVPFLDAETDAVIALTPHHLHAQYVMKAIKYNKPLLLEKPLCIHEEELKMIESLCQQTPMPLIMIGHNRRFSPHIQKIKEWLRGRSDPLMMHIQINAGFLKKTHWVHSEKEGRSRIVGEMTHFIDLIQYLTDEEPIHIYAQRVSGNNHTIVNNDNIIVNLKMNNGSLASLFYGAMGNRGYSREQLTLFFDEQSIICDNYKKTVLFSRNKKIRFKTSQQEMGHKEILNHFIQSLYQQTGSEYLNENIKNMQVVFAIENSLAKNKPICL